MKQIQNKLKSESGVSILFALLLMLVVAMVSVVMVNASLTAVKRTSAKKDNQQVSISLDSAALLMRDKISSDDGYTLIKKATSEDSYSIVPAEVDSAFRDEIQKISSAYAKVANTEEPLNNCTGEFKIVTTVENNSDTVKVNYEATKMDNGSARVLFTLSEGEDVSQSQLFVSFNVSLKNIDQMNPKVVWQYGGASLEREQ